MLRAALILFIISVTGNLSAQTLDKLTVEKIMRDPTWIGTSPSGFFWNTDGTRLYFQWNPDNAPSDSLYYITPTDKIPRKTTPAEKQFINSPNNSNYNTARTAYVYSKNGDIFYKDVRTSRERRVTHTTDMEFSPVFSFNDSRIVYNRSQNLYAWDINTGETIQLTNTRAADPATTTAGARGNAANAAVTGSTIQEQWLKNDQLEYFEVLKDRKAKREVSEAYNKSLPKEKELKVIRLEDRSIQGLNISPDGRFVHYRLFKPAPPTAKSTIVPNYVTESGFTTDIPARTKVGAPSGSSEFFIYDRQRDTIFKVNTDSIPGISDIPSFVKDYPTRFKEQTKKQLNRPVSFTNPNWSPRGTHMIVEARTEDNKDRWLLLWDTASGNFKMIDRQHDDAWVGGPGTSGFGSGNTGWLDESNYWFHSEETGYSHIYTYDIIRKEKKAITSGNYEVQQVQLSKDKKAFYIITNEVHPGEQHFYKLNIGDGNKTRLTNMQGANQVSLSPDEKHIAILHSYSTRPWELYLQENRTSGKSFKSSEPLQITDKAQSNEFKSYPWRDPQVVTFTASDGATVYARLYKPANEKPGKPAVLFVHGAGYLQNAHKWWSSYFREYMFNNLLADNGYYVLDVDYRGSAGYGRDWRTGIYRHMGGKDLSDHVDAVKYLSKNFGIDEKKVGLYGGSYGGFITLMGLFTEPDVFVSGAALRPVTDWAQYNHGYTSNILNEPYTDSIAYRKSSPLYFAEGLKGHLLICHGMVDINVHYQDAVKLTQRLIELGKDNWELASYPMEDHGFVEPSSWTDEYKRIFKLFERTLK